MFFVRPCVRAGVCVNKNAGADVLLGRSDKAGVYSVFVVLKVVAQRRR